MHHSCNYSEKCRNHASSSHNFSMHLKKKRCCENTERTGAAFQNSCYHTVKYASTRFIILHYIHEYVACNIPKIAGRPTASCAFLQYASQYVFISFWPKCQNNWAAESTDRWHIIALQAETYVWARGGMFRVTKCNVKIMCKLHAAVNTMYGQLPHRRVSNLEHSPFLQMVFC